MRRGIASRQSDAALTTDRYGLPSRSSQCHERGAASDERDAGPPAYRQMLTQKSDADDGDKYDTQLVDRGQRARHLLS